MRTRDSTAHPLRRTCYGAPATAIRAGCTQRCRHHHHVRWWVAPGTRCVPAQHAVQASTATACNPDPALRPAAEATSNGTQPCVRVETARACNGQSTASRRPPHGEDGHRMDNGQWPATANDDRCSNPSGTNARSGPYSLCRAGQAR